MVNDVLYVLQGKRTDFSKWTVEQIKVQRILIPSLKDVYSKEDESGSKCALV